MRAIACGLYSLVFTGGLIMVACLPYRLRILRATTREFAIKASTRRDETSSQSLTYFITSGKTAWRAWPTARPPRNRGSSTRSASARGNSTRGACRPGDNTFGERAAAAQHHFILGEVELLERGRVEGQIQLVVFGYLGRRCMNDVCICHLR